jgi:diacylglycerol kinase (ATP)
MRVTLLHNPTAGDDPAPADELVHELCRAGYAVSYVAAGSGELDLPEDLGAMVVVAGGDGTVCRAVKRLAGSGVPLAILPVGTANNIARALGQVGAVSRLVAGWGDGVRAALDLGIVRGPRGEERFVEAFGGGAFARMIAAGVDRRGADRAGFAGNRIDRGLQMLCQALAAEPCRRWRLDLDGEVLDGEFLFVEVMNIGFLGPSMPLAPAADPTDGYFDLLLATEDDRAALLDYAEHRLHGSVARPPPLAVRRGRRLSGVPGADHVHVDDRSCTTLVEHGGDRSVEVTLDHGALEVMMGIATPPHVSGTGGARARSPAPRGP